ncbi:MAG TPA: hypothetical protein DEH78_14485 [Solibacterales bacterium]|nr:hypothetical protein [Bryobacterales bacterium]
MRFMRAMTVLAAAVLWAAPSFGAAVFFPLQTGNEWVYRNARWGDGFHVRVGLPVMINGRVYHALDGYTEKRLLVRVDERGQLLAVNEETGREELVTSFETPGGGWWPANGRICGGEGETQERREEHDGPAGPFREVLSIRYRGLSCADYGAESEQFAENIGMVRRVNQTLLGPRVHDLVYARVGRSVIEARPHGRFTLVVEPDVEQGFLRATLRLQTGPAGPLRLEFPSSQVYEVLVKDAAGAVLWRYSDGLVFLPAVHPREFAGEWSAEVRIPQPSAERFTVQAWMTTSEPSFAAMVPGVGLEPTRHLRGKGVRVNTTSPGFIEAPIRGADYVIDGGTMPTI